MTTVNRCHAVLGLLDRSCPHLLDRAKTIHKALSDNPALFVTPNPPLATIESRIQALDEAQQAARTRGLGMVAVRDVKALELRRCLETTRGYVQEVADASPEQGAAIILAASMSVRQPKTRTKPFLQARQSAPSAAVQVIANVAALVADTTGKVVYNWQSSSDGDKTWIAAPSTPPGHTELTGLTPMETYAFRVSATDAHGPHEWSPAVSLLVR